MASKRTNYILIDHENVGSLELGEMAGHPVRVLIFLGEQQTKLPVAAVQKMLELRDRVDLVVMKGTGRNALDFHIAFYAGQIAAKDPDAYLYIISKDKGFDPLIDHLKSNHVHARRSEKVADIPILRTRDASQLSLGQRVQRVVEHLENNPQSRPRKRKTLDSSIHALFGKELNEAEIAAVIQELEKTGKLKVQTDDKIAYSLR